MRYSSEILLLFPLSIIIWYGKRTSKYRWNPVEDERERDPIHSSHSESNIGEDFGLQDGKIHGRQLVLESKNNDHGRKQTVEEEESHLRTLSPYPISHYMRLWRMQQGVCMADLNPWRLGEDASVPACTKTDLLPLEDSDTPQHVSGRTRRNGKCLKMNGTGQTSSFDAPNELWTRVHVFPIQLTFMGFRWARWDHMYMEL
jgi:hypothetical protein